MNESTGGALLLNLVIIVVGAMIAIFTASFAYTKAYRAKSIIIDEIENHGIIKNPSEFNDIVKSIDEQLTNMGYRKDGKECPNKGNEQPLNKYITEKKSYCIYQMSEEDDVGNVSIYYEVQTYMYFDIPLFNFTIPVKGQTISYRQTMTNVEDEI